VNAEAQALLTRAATVEAQRQPAVARGDRHAETAALLALAELRRVYRAAVDAAKAREPSP